jgi:hypothetical protein
MHTNPEDIYRGDPEIGFNKVFYKENEDKSKFKDLLNSELINVVN